MFMKMSFAKISSYTSAAETTPLQPNNNNNNVNNVRHSCILSKTLWNHNATISFCCTRMVEMSWKVSNKIVREKAEQLFGRV